MNYGRGRVWWLQNHFSCLLTTNYWVNSSNPLVIQEFWTALWTKACMEKTKHSCIGGGWKLVVDLRNLGLVLKPFETLAKWSATLSALTWNGLLTMPAGFKKKLKFSSWIGVCFCFHAGILPVSRQNLCNRDLFLNEHSHRNTARHLPPEEACCHFSNWQNCGV